MSDRLTDGSDMTAVQGPETRKRFPGLFNPTVDREAGLPLHLLSCSEPCSLTSGSKIKNFSIDKIRKFG